MKIETVKKDERRGKKKGEGRRRRKNMKELSRRAQVHSCSALENSQSSGFNR